jgi:hypothetical protein
MYQYDGKNWGSPTVTVEGDDIPLTTTESERIPWAQVTSQCVLTFSDLSQELAVNFNQTHLSARFPRVERAWLSRILEPNVAVPVLMGAHTRLGANSGLYTLEAGLLRTILEHTLIDYKS